MKELSPEQKRILGDLTNNAQDGGAWGRVTRAYRVMPNTRVFPGFGEPNPDWPLEELERKGLVEAEPIQGTDELEWTITRAGAEAIGKILVEEE
jgi:hypothetical protein